MHVASAFGYEFSALCRLAMYLLTAVTVAWWGWKAARRIDGLGVLVMALLAGNALLGASGASRDVVGAVATPIAATLCAYVLWRQTRA